MYDLRDCWMQDDITNIWTYGYVYNKGAKANAYTLHARMNVLCKQTENAKGNQQQQKLRSDAKHQKCYDGV